MEGKDYDWQEEKVNIPISTANRWWFEGLNGLDLQKYWETKLEIWKRNYLQWIKIP